MPQGEVLMSRSGQPVMELDEYPYDPDFLNFNPAYKELLDHTANSAGTSYTWGYFPELEPNPKDLSFI